MITVNLSTLGVAFIDVGLGIHIQDGRLVGIIRTTASDGAKTDHLVKRISSDDVDDNDYATNIQIADLNASNACKAVEKWKKMCGFYLDEVGEFHSTYTISASLLVNGDF
jgi:dUTPase